MTTFAVLAFSVAPIAKAILMALFVLTGLLLATVVLLQEGKGGGIAGAFGGAAGETFGVKAGSVNRFTSVLAGVFILIALTHAGISAATESVIAPSPVTPEGPPTTPVIDMPPPAMGTPPPAMTDTPPAMGGEPPATPPVAPPPPAMNPPEPAPAPTSPPTPPPAPAMNPPEPAPAPAPAMN